MASPFALTRFRPGGSPFGGGAVARRSGPSPALKKAQEALAATRSRLSAARANTQGKGAAGEAALYTLGGGVLSGAMKAKFPEVMGYDSRIPAAVVLVGAGMFGVKGRIGGALVNAGAGVAACIVSDFVEDMLDGDESATSIEEAA